MMMMVMMMMMMMMMMVMVVMVYVCVRAWVESRDGWRGPGPCGPTVRN
jgi:hypothetical protein